jgi:glycosyltransferase involved in cell wall biosynthesis
VKILASHDGGSGCAWYRMIVPLTAVDKHSPDCSVTWRSGGMATMNNPPPPLALTDIDGHDILVAQRVNAYEGLGLWRRWNTPWTRTVYENDDDVFNITRDNVQAYAAYEKGTETREAVLRYCDTASLVTTTTPHLGDYHRDLSPGVPVEVLPNYINDWVLNLPRDSPDRRLRVGWMGGSSHVRDLEQAAGAVSRFIRREPEWDLYVSGTDYRRSFQVPDERSFYVPWIHVTNEPQLFYRMIDYDIGICPLFDTQFARSKSPIKALEYSARGIPVIASDVEPYRRFVKHGETGFLIKQGQTHDWLSKLQLLAHDEDLRLKMGAAAKQLASQWTIEEHWPKWVNAYKMLFPVNWEYKG